MNHFPFLAIVGLELAKRSLIYHAIDPRLGGTLLLGHRGCAKSTLARAFAAILPANGNGSDVPFVEVPLGTTDDRLLGSVDAGSLLDEGKWKPRAGLIEQAHGGVLYIDEINLLPDHLADFILDSAATGQYRMERDGLTKAVASRYILIGSMNPDEGDLRPQLTDRFAHGVRIRDEYSAPERVEIVKRRMEFDDDGESFKATFLAEEKALLSKINEARQCLGVVSISDEHRASVAEKAKHLRLEGVRAELAVMRTARAAAAWNGRVATSDEDIEEAWTLCLGHRSNESAPQEPPSKASGRESNPPPQSPAASTPQFPQGAHAQPRIVPPVNPTQHATLLDWWRKPDGRPDRKHSILGPATAMADTGKRISWIGSLTSSLRAGWKPGIRGWQLRYESVARKPAAWIFIDASRSAGARQFLGAVRDNLRGMLGSLRSTRFHLLVLRDGKLRWNARRATSRRLAAELRSLDSAAGKSFLVDAAKQLRRAIVRGGVSSADRALVCTDGFVSPCEDETPAQAVTALHEGLRRLGLSGVRTAWLHPPMQRGMAGWIKRVSGSLPIRKIELSSR